MAKIGVDNLHYAKIIKDDKTGLTYDTPVSLTGVREIKVNPKVSTEPLYGDNKVLTQTTAIDSIEVSIDIADLTNQQYHDLLGHKLGATGGIIAGGQDVAPPVALLWKSQMKSIDGSPRERYTVLYKGQFELASDEHKGQEGKIDYQTDELKGSFSTTINTGDWKYQVDSDDSLFTSVVRDAFFTSVLVAKEKVETPPVGV